MRCTQKKGGLGRNLLERFPETAEPTEGRLLVVEERYHEIPPPSTRSWAYHTPPDSEGTS